MTRRSLAGLTFALSLLAPALTLALATAVMHDLGYHLVYAAPPAQEAPPSVAYAAHVQTLARQEPAYRQAEWSRGLGFEVPLAHLEAVRQIRQAAVRNEQANRLREWSAGLGFDLPAKAPASR